MGKGYIMFVRFVLCLVAVAPTYAQLSTTSGTVLTITPSTSVGVQANVVNQGSMTNTGTLFVYNNWSNPGTYTGPGIINLSGADQQFNHGGASLSSLFVNGGGVKQVSGGVTITEALVLSNGKVNVAPGVAFRTASTASITGASASSYVLGRMQVAGKGNHFYPIGTPATFTPVELIGVQGTSPVVAFEAKEPHPAAQNGLGIQEVSQARHWERTIIAGEMTGGKIKLPAIGESFLASMSNASVAGSDELGGVYESLGQQTTTGTVDNGSVTSFEDALVTFYALARELNEGRLADSVALVKIYNRANGDNWSNNDNWLQTNIDSWAGVSVQGGRVVGVNLAANNLTGRLTSNLRKLSNVVSLNFSNNQIGQGVPASIVQMGNLQMLNLSNNNLIDLPDVTGLPAIQLLDVSANRLEFDDLEPNIGIPNFNYGNQGRFGVEVDSLQPVHQPYLHALAPGGSANQYQWFRNGTPVAGATGKQLRIDDLVYENMGDYELRVTNPVVPDLILRSNIQRIRATASASGLVTDLDQAAVGGATGSALGIRTGRYDTTASYQAGGDGSFVVNNLVLGDYLLYASQDKTLYIPTYYRSSIDWAFADVINLRDNTSGINLEMQNRPRPLTPDDGDNVVGGFLDEDLPGQGKVLDRKRVSGAGVSISRQRFRSKGNEDEVFYELVVYVETDENGEFLIEDIPDGDYRLNIQYPGIPMDPTSFVDFSLGGGAGLEQNKLSLEALVTETAIVVTKVKETGIYLSYFKNLEVYPNPADKFVTIRYEKLVKGDVVAELMDLNGNQLMFKDLKDRSRGNEKLNTTSLRDGVYILRFHDRLVPGRPIITYRVIVSR